MGTPIPNNAFTQAIIDWFTLNPDPITPTNPEIAIPIYGKISHRLFPRHNGQEQHSREKARPAIAGLLEDSAQAEPLERSI